jgi:hypothetical protein
LNVICGYMKIGWQNMNKNFWYFECLICKNLNKIFYRCDKALFKPRSINGICEHYEEKNND